MGACFVRLWSSSWLDYHEKEKKCWKIDKTALMVVTRNQQFRFICLNTKKNRRSALTRISKVDKSQDLLRRLTRRMHFLHLHKSSTPCDKVSIKSEFPNESDDQNACRSHSFNIEIDIDSVDNIQIRTCFLFSVKPLSLSLFLSMWLAGNEFQIIRGWHPV